jgi:predicted Zn-ribbon and HTH transcriptional regulator
MCELRSQIRKLLQNSEHSMTIPQICNSLNVEDELDVLPVVSDLEYTNDVKITGMKKLYMPDGCAAYLAEYTYIYLE